MKLRVIKIQKQKSKRSNFYFYYVFMKNIETGKSYRTCVSPEFRNFRWWEGIREGDIIEINDEMVYNNLVNADCMPKIIGGYEK